MNQPPQRDGNSAQRESHGKADSAESAASRRDQPSLGTNSQSSDETIPPLGFMMPPVLQPGAHFGRYHIKRLLGQGGMGAVFLADDTELHRLVALKVPTITGNDKSQWMRRFYREARSAAKLNHPNICQVYDIGEASDIPYLTMAYIDGPTLASVMRRRLEPITAREALLVTLKVARALTAAHEGGVVHRDLKPGNIMINSRREPIVTDFGLALQLQDDDARLTRDGVMLGTPSYMSPEQIEGDPNRVGPAADQFSLGVILFELLTGQLPFQGSTARVIGQIVCEPPPRPSDFRPEIEPELERLCLQMLEKQAADRFSSMQDVVSRLESYIRASTPSTVALQPPAPPPQAAQYGPLVAEAVELLASQNYEQAVATLDKIPVDHRSVDATQLYAKANRLKTECQSLNAQMHTAVQTRQYADLQPSLVRLLELEPGNLQARDIFEKLCTYGPRQSFRFDAQGQLLRSTPPTAWERFLYQATSFLRRRNARRFASRQTNRTTPPWIRRLFELAPRRLRTMEDESLLTKWLGLAAAVFLVSFGLMSVAVYIYRNRDENRGNQVAKLANDAGGESNTTSSNNFPLPEITHVAAKIPGIIPNPKPLPGATHWQIATRWPHCRINDVDYSPLGTRVAVASGPYVRILDAVTLELRAILAGQRGETMCVAWSPDGTMIAAGGTDRTVHLWKSDGTPVAMFSDNEGMIDDVAWHPESQLLAYTDLWKGVVIGRRDGTIERSIELRDKTRVHAVDWHPTDGSLAVGTHRGILVYYPNYQSKSTSDHTRWTRAVKWSPDGRWLVGSGDKIELMSPDLTVAHTFDAEGWGDHHRIAWSPKSHRFAVSKHPHVRRFTIQGEELPKLKGADTVDSIAWAPNDDTLFMAGYRFAMFNTTDWSRVILTESVAAPTYSLDLRSASNELADGHFSKICVRSLDGRRSRVIPHEASHLAWLPNTGDVLTMRWPNRLHRVNANGEEVTTYDTGGDDKPYWRMAVSPDGQLVAARVESYGDFSLRLWNQDGTLRKLIPVDHDPRDFDWDWTQARLVVTSGNGIRFYDSQGEPDDEFSTNFRPDYVRFSPIGDRVATAKSGTNGVCVLESSGEELFRSTPTPGWGTRRLAWAPDGERLAYSDWGRHEIHITNMEGRVTHILEGHHCSDAIPQWSRDGRVLITAGRDGMVQARDGRDYALQWVGLTTRTQQPTWSVDGEVLYGDEEANARELIYLVADNSERVEILEQETFFQRTGRAADQAENLIENGSFERPWIESGFSNSGKLSLPGWHADDVDLVYSYFEAASGMQSLDMSGGRSGSVRQTVVTAAEQDYTLSFYVSVNPNPEGVKSMQVSWDGKMLDEIRVSTEGRTTRNMRWQRREYRVRATSSSTELRFISLDRTGSGVALDNVRLEPIAPRP